ncbi:hypothetical protein [Nocardia nova]|uniref:hypothetical protein n=1 Tax=Nocardia nova TaxID=37330 RepID=UPI0033D4C85D
MSIRLGPRDMQSLTVIAEHYGTPLDLVAQMHDVGMSSAYRTVQRWREANLIAPLSRPVPGPSWVVPTTATAEALLGISVRHWAPRLKMVEHVTAVLQTRLALVGTDLERWVSERELRHEVGPTRPGVARPHIHDGRFLNSEGEWWAVEVELSPKTSHTVARSALLGARQAAERAGLAGVLYLCRGERVKTVIREAAQGLERSRDIEIRMKDLDQFLPERPSVKVTKKPRTPLRLVVGGTDAPARDSDWTRP